MDIVKLQTGKYYDPALIYNVTMIQESENLGLLAERGFSRHEKFTQNINSNCPTYLIGQNYH